MTSSDSLTLKAVSVASVCVLIWGGQSVAVKYALTGLEPLTVIALRFALSVPVLVLIALLLKTPLRPGREDRVALGLNAVMFSTQICLFTFGTDYTTSIHSIILIHTFPFFAALAGHFFLPGSRLNPTVVVGLCVAFAGVPVLVLGSAEQSAGGIRWGDLAVLGAAAVTGCKIVFMKRTLERVPALRLTFWDAATALALFSVLAVVFDQGGKFEVNATVAAAMLYQGVVVSVAGFLLWLHLLGRYSANQLNAFRLFTPPVGVLLGAMLLKEPAGAPVVLSVILITFGLYLVRQSSRPLATTRA